MASKTITLDWSAGDSNFGQVLSGKDSDKYYSLPISTINSALVSNGITTGITITNFSLTCNAYFECSQIISCNCDIGYGGNGSISTYLLSGGSISGNDMKYDRDFTVSLKDAISGASLSTSKGSYITFRIYTDEWGKKSYKVSNIRLTVEYQTSTHTITVNKGTGCSSVSGGGTYNYGATVTISATGNTGYVFKSWSDGNTANPRSITVSGNATYTANFKPRKIYVANKQPTIYVGNKAVKAVYVGNTLIYEN